MTDPPLCSRPPLLLPDCCFFQTPGFMALMWFQSPGDPDRLGQMSQPGHYACSWYPRGLPLSHSPQRPLRVCDIAKAGEPGLSACLRGPGVALSREEQGLLGHILRWGGLGPCRKSDPHPTLSTPSQLLAFQGRSGSPLLLAAQVLGELGGFLDKLIVQPLSLDSGQDAPFSAEGVVSGTLITLPAPVPRIQLCDLQMLRSLAWDFQEKSVVRPELPPE